MFPEWLAAVPTWLVAGVLLGSGVSCCVAVVFVVGDRLFPTAPVDSSRHIDGTVRRRQDIRQYLVDVDERFLEDHTIHGETVAFYLPDRDVAIVVQSGSGVVREGETDHPVAPGDLVVVEAGTARGVKASDGERLEAVLVTAPPPTDAEHEPVREGIRRGAFDPREGSE